MKILHACFGSMLLICCSISYGMQTPRVLNRSASRDSLQGQILRTFLMMKTQTDAHGWQKMQRIVRFCLAPRVYHKILFQRWFAIWCPTKYFRGAMQNLPIGGMARRKKMITRNKQRIKVY